MERRAARRWQAPGSPPGPNPRPRLRAHPREPSRCSDLLIETRPSERGALPAGISQSSVTRPCESGAEGTGTMSTVPCELSTEASQPGVPSSWASGVTGFAPGSRAGGAQATGCARCTRNLQRPYDRSHRNQRSIGPSRHARTRGSARSQMARARPRSIPGAAQMRAQTCSGASTGSMSASHGPRRRSHSATRSANARSLSTRACTARCWMVSNTPNTNSPARTSSGGGSGPSGPLSPGGRLGLFTGPGTPVIASNRGESNS